MSVQKEYNKIEDAILELLEGDLQENALNFATYLNENQLIPNMSAWGKIPFNGYNLGWMRIEGKNKWLFQILTSLISVIFTMRTKSLPVLYMTT